MGTMILNGVNGVDGRYWHAPLELDEVARWAKGSTAGDTRELKHFASKRDQRTLGVVDGVTPRDLAQTGWAAVFAQNADPKIRDALRPLLAWRREQASRRDERFYREYSGEQGYAPGESKLAFLVRHGVSPAAYADPRTMPYYLLLVGDPETIPFSFQYQLDVQYGVGRIHFDALEDYERYAVSVVAAEKEAAQRQGKPRRFSLFAPANPDDLTTQLSSQYLVQPLADELGDHDGWRVEAWLQEDASKACLDGLFRGPEPPSLLFSASHGVVFDKDHLRQRPCQGAVICQDWQGPKSQGITQDSYFSSHDLDDGAHVAGMVAFLFNCFGAGTPRWDAFGHRHEREPREELASAGFVSGLAKRLLAHPGGGALALVGHVERAWGCSFLWDDRALQIQTFQQSLRRLLKGERLGWAMESFNQRYAELASEIHQWREAIRYGMAVKDTEFLELWTACNDARNYVVIGDPAVRLGN